MRPREWSSAAHHSEEGCDHEAPAHLTGAWEQDVENVAEMIIGRLVH